MFSHSLVMEAHPPLTSFAVSIATHTAEKPQQPTKPILALQVPQPQFTASCELSQASTTAASPLSKSLSEFNLHATPVPSPKHVRFLDLPVKTFPAINDILMVRVKNATDSGLLVHILGYHCDGFVPASGVSFRRKKNYSPSTTFKVGKELPAKVTSVDSNANGTFIDLTLKDVNAVEARECARERPSKSPKETMSASPQRKVSAKISAKKSKSSQPICPAFSPTSGVEDSHVVHVAAFSDEYIQHEVAELILQARRSSLDTKTVHDSVRLEILSLKNQLNVPVADCAIALLKALVLQTVADHTNTAASTAQTTKKPRSLASFLGRTVRGWADLLAQLSPTPDASLELLLWACEFFDSGVYNLDTSLFAHLLKSLYDYDIVTEDAVIRWHEWCVEQGVFLELVDTCAAFLHWLKTADIED